MGRYCTRCRRYGDGLARCNAETQCSNRLSEFCFAKYLGSEVLADDELTAESQHYPGKRGLFQAHRLILALHIEDFKAMFYGEGPREDKIEITNLHPDGFGGLLRFLYTGKLQVENVPEASYTRAAAIKYKLPELAAKCATYVSTNIRPEHVCPLLENILTMSDQGMDAPARHKLRTQCLAVVSSTNFASWRECTVKYVLDHISGVPEKTMIAAVYEWAHQQ